MDKTETIGNYKLTDDGAVYWRSFDKPEYMILDSDGMTCGVWSGKAVTEAYAIQQKHFESKRKAEAERAPGVELPDDHTWEWHYNRWNLCWGKDVVAAVPIQNSPQYQHAKLVVAAADDLAARAKGGREAEQGESKCTCHLTQNQACDRHFPTDVRPSIAANNPTTLGECSTVELRMGAQPVEPHYTYEQAREGMLRGEEWDGYVQAGFIRMWRPIRAESFLSYERLRQRDNDKWVDITAKDVFDWRPHVAAQPVEPELPLREGQAWIGVTRPSPAALGINVEPELPAWKVGDLAWFHPHDDCVRFSCVIDGPPEDRGGTICIRIRELEERHAGSKDTAVVVASALRPRRAGDDPNPEMPLPEWATKLTEWANSTAARYGHPVHLVGSSLFATDVSKTRDVDVVCVISDDEFKNRFGAWAKCFNLVHARETESTRWHREMAKEARFATNALPGINIDFKVQCPAWLAAYDHDRKPWARLDALGDIDVETELPKLPERLSACIQMHPATYGIAKADADALVSELMPLFRREQGKG